MTTPNLTRREFGKFAGTGAFIASVATLSPSSVAAAENPKLAQTSSQVG
jgi:hypothetical protein